ncbi:uncharacterized protein LOC128597167 [Nycticebus coucang]|uniref:uncharacterized protein LOC128597167 n=1 Tax=Nycticebus coucang TaxID=9470 RepID=UPI00234C6548|nr:uncharacterized protein LOC128597167 [Nycticebus coucang]XP_053463294.1 uncharacterized protein LOC128597167 [Nycticebus coucang]XP_053463295.1 uncharacterized protein LOC128597167 [Nycticebus coucang]
MSAKRKSYSVEYKKGIVEDSWGQNLTAFCKEKMLSIRLVRKWRAEYGNLIEQVDKGNAKKRKCGSGRQPLFSELEDLVCEWVVDRRAKALVVNRARIQEFALAMAPQFDIAPEDFKASQHWLDNFLQRSELSLRRSTTLFRLEDTQVTTVPYTGDSSRCCNGLAITLAASRWTLRCPLPWSSRGHDCQCWHRRRGPVLHILYVLHVHPALRRTPHSS